MTSVTVGPCEKKARDSVEKKDSAKNPKAGAEFTDAIDDNIKDADREKLAPVVAAVRAAENGPTGPPPAGAKHLEYGILHKRCPNTYRGQAGWCAKTVQNNYDRYKKAGGDPNDMKAFIKFLGSKYAPVGVENDPDDLNINWVPNVTYFYKVITKDC